eukprot:CAMPEP_0174888754 /NCGR_PEP_ID=MMETSP0167-20121228/4025_1 /TAXON_ID=38298 /ORGANISM="Rhodella maculata, Strain CCMP736" /LENGTH=80 /DNA_ID=CAMNT_0016125887 /DNA_START=134 /DNA_END=376 /DNA_ORIENTATION=+
MRLRGLFPVHKGAEVRVPEERAGVCEDDPQVRRADVVVEEVGRQPEDGVADEDGAEGASEPENELRPGLAREDRVVAIVQ